MKLIEKITNLIILEDNCDLYKTHISLVVKYVEELSLIENEDSESLILAALLHDLGRIRYSGKDHNVSGAKDARKILELENYPSDKIDLICNSILSHGGSVLYPAKNTFSKILMSADALSRLDSVFSLFSLYLNKFEGNVKLALEKLSAKLDSNWNTKIVLDSAKKLGSKKYFEAKSILKSNLKLFEGVELEK